MEHLNHLDIGDRRSGRTTRIIDQCVQEFFADGFTVCRDHYPSKHMHEYVYRRVWKRLYDEHNVGVWAEKPVGDSKNYIIANDDTKLIKAKKLLNTAY